MNLKTKHLNIINWVVSNIDAYPSYEDLWAKVEEDNFQEKIDEEFHMVIHRIVREIYFGHIKCIELDGTD